MRWKTSLLVRSEILGLFGNTLTADHMYSGNYWEKVPQQVQTLLSQQPKKFSRIFIGILDSRQNLEHFEKKDQLHSLNILEVIKPRKGGWFNAR